MIIKEKILYRHLLSQKTHLLLTFSRLVKYSTILYSTAEPFNLLISTAVIANTGHIILKKDIRLGEEAVIFTTAQGELIFNYYAFPEKVAQQIKPYKKGQCLEIQSQYGFFKDTGDGQYIQSIRPCQSRSGLS